MKEKFEDYVKKNRATFDDEMPGDKVWRGVERHIPAGSAKGFKWVWQAAAIIFFATSAFLLVDKFEGQENAVATNESFNQVEDFYFQEISQKRALIYDMSETGVSSEAELQKLDAMYLVLKEQFKEKPSQEVAEALTLNLIVRLDLLNQVVADIEESDELAGSNGLKEESQIEI